MPLSKESLRMKLVTTLLDVRRLSRRPPERPLHLFEIGLAWPPEAFISRKLKGLATQGLRVTAAARVSRRAADASRLRGVELKRLPRRDQSVARMLPRVAVGSIAVATREPRLFRALVGAVWRAAPRGSRVIRARRVLRGLDQFLPVVRVRPDVVHFEWNDWAVDYLPLLEVWERPVIVSCRGTAVNARPLLPVHQEFARGLAKTFEVAAAVHCVSDAMLRQARRYGLEQSKARVIRPAVDPAFFVPPAQETPTNGRFRVAAVGLLRWEKGYEYALLALRQLVDRGVPVRLDVLGADPIPGPDAVSDRPRLLHAIADLGVEDHVRLLGPAQPEGVRELLHRAHAFLHASVAEGLPNVVLEAMACALPVVVTDAGGTREAVRDGIEGFVVPPRDPHALADALEMLWSDATLRRRLGRAGRVRIEAEFSLDRQMRAFEALYREAAAR